MATNLRTGKTSPSLVAMLCIACGLAACTTQEADSTGAAGSGGTTGAPASTGGSTAPGSDGTLCAGPAAALITDFTYTASTTTSTSQPNLSTSTTFSGAGLWDNASPSQLTSDVTQGNWRIKGTLSNYAGFNFFLRDCDRIDASKYKGISFTISGSNAQGITFGMGTVNDTATGTWMSTVGGKTTAKPTDVGRCTPKSGNQYYHPGCVDPQIKLPITVEPKVQAITWDLLTGGEPDPSVAPSGLTSLWWTFVWADGTSPYDIDIVIDDLKFIE